MVKHKFLRRFKAAVVGAAMIATSAAVPVVNYSSSIVSAAATEVKSGSLPYTLVSDGVEDGKRQANFGLSADLKGAETLSITLSSTGSANIGIYGFGISKDPYWVNNDFSKDIPSGKTTLQVAVPKEAQGFINKVGIGIWYPKDSSVSVDVESITGSGSAVVPGGPSGPSGPAVVPTTENDKSGTYTFKDNGDGTATITATLSAQYQEGDSSEFEIPLTQGYDEESFYAPFKDKNGDTLPKWQEGDPINSHKFLFSNFGIDDLENIKFQSFEYVVTTDDYNMDNFQYGGGISVNMGSPADTEYALGKDGYWYNDHSEEDIAKNADKFGIDDVHPAYKAENCGTYAKLTWDVPKGVQPYIDYSNSFNSTSFQYWWGCDQSKPSTDEDGNEMEYTVIPEVTIKSCTATYTRSMIVPYTETIKGSGAATVAMTGNTDFDLTELDLGPRDKLSAIRLTFNSGSEMQKFVGGLGISTDEAKVQKTQFNEDATWYQPGNVCVINNGPTFDVMWILPENIRDGVWSGKGGNAQLGYYYGDKEGGDTISSVKISDVNYYVYRSQEDDLSLTDKDGLEIPDEISLNVGDEYPIKTNVDGCEYSSTRTNVADVDDNGVIHALAEGLTEVTVKTPEGQEKTITVKVYPGFDPEKDIDWSKVIWGDVDVNGSVELADVTELSKFLLNNKIYPLKNATARENADCKYDSKIESSDLSKLIEFNLGKITMDDLGPTDPEIRKKATWYQTHSTK